MTWKIVAIDADFNKPCWDVVNVIQHLDIVTGESKKKQNPWKYKLRSSMHCSSCEIMKIAGAIIQTHSIARAGWKTEQTSPVYETKIPLYRYVCNN